jgi:hypothetical protein
MFREWRRQRSGMVEIRLPAELIFVLYRLLRFSQQMSK